MSPNAIRIARVCTAAVLVFGICNTPAVAQSGSVAERARLRALTQTIATLGDEYHVASPAARPDLLDQLLANAAARHALLAALIDAEPAIALDVAIPSQLRAALPPQVQNHIEQREEREGTLEVLQEDYRGGSRLRHLLHSGNSTYVLKYVDEAPALRTGVRVRVRGVRLDDTLVLELGGTSSSVQSTAAVPDTFGAQRTAIILVNFEDNSAQPYTIADAARITFTTTSDYMREASFQQTWLTGNVFGWFTIAMSSTVCDTTTLATLAKQAATAAGADLSAYTRYVYAFPQNACTFWGLGSIGGTPSQAWINGDLQIGVVAHELGHNLGLYHAHSMDCGASPITAPCTTDEYGDGLDMMGGAAGHYSAAMKERLGWLGGSSPAITVVASDGTYSLEPFESASGGAAKALKIQRSIDPATGNRGWYFVEFRQPIGYDNVLAPYPGTTNGVVVRTGKDGAPDSTYLLDMTPDTASWSDPALAVGRSFTDPDAGITIQTVAAGTTGAVVSVAFSGAAPNTCTNVAPGVSVSPSTGPSVAPGTTVSYVITVVNRDDNACGTSIFKMGAAMPAWWSGAFDAYSLTLAPGASGSATLQIASSTTATAGSYALTISATNAATPSAAVSMSATYTVSAPPAPALTVTVGTDAATYTRNQNVKIRAVVGLGTNPVKGAAVTFSVKKPDGTTQPLSGTTDASGAATASVKLPAKPQVGTWSVTAAAAVNGSTGSAVTTFTVK